MTEHFDIRIPENLSFEEALELTQVMLDRHAAGALTGEDLQQIVTTLVSSENGARGFFVVFLSTERSLADSDAKAIVDALRTAPDIVSPLLIKNLAMSTAMGITHRRSQNAELAAGSDQVKAQSLHLIQQLQTPKLKEEATSLAESLATSAGSYQGFLERWGYDAEQRHAIEQALQQTGLL